MAYTTIDNPELYFQAKLFTGNGSAASSTQSITFDGSENMLPDWVWFKKRDGAEDHEVFDSVRGVQKAIDPNNNNAEATGRGLTSFDSNGFTVGNGSSAGNQGPTNEINKTFTTWNWKASGSTASNTDGSITSTVSANITAGFSIVSWTGSGSGATIGHGLGVQPQIVFVKNRDDTASWSIYTVDGGGGKGLFLNENNGYDSDSSYFNNGTASATTFPVGTANISNGSSDNMIAYCFANVKGYSKIGSYVGNGNVDGTFVYTGFKPAWILTKCTDTARNWNIRDNKVNPFNVTEAFFEANGTVQEQTDPGYSSIDILSNGFKHRGVGGDTNVSGDGYIFMAFAESPFVNSNGIPNNAR